MAFRPGFRPGFRPAFQPALRPAFGDASDLRAAILKSLFGDGSLGTAQFSDLNRLFTTSTGQTNSPLNDPVGLRLDLAQGAELGPELVTNGTFDTDIDGWIPSTAGATSANVEWDDGRLKLTRTGTATGQAGHEMTGFVVGQRYTIKATKVGSNTLVAIRDGFSLSGPLAFNTGYNNAEDVSGSFVANSTTMWILLASTTITPTYFDNISTRELKGNHASQSTAADRPTVTGNPARITYGAGDNLVTAFPAELGTNVTVARSIPGTGAQILTGQTVGTSFTDNVDNHALIIVNRALTGDETTQLTALLNKEAGL